MSTEDCRNKKKKGRNFRRIEKVSRTPETMAKMYRRNNLIAFISGETKRILVL